MTRTTRRLQLSMALPFLSTAFPLITFLLCVIMCVNSTYDPKILVNPKKAYLIKVFILQAAQENSPGT